jgi:HSP20 family protein
MEKKLDQKKNQGELVVDIYEENKELVVRAPIAGINLNDIEVIFEDDTLIIKGERKEQEKRDEKNYFLKECFFGPFLREIILPKEIDSSRARAKYENGFLIIKAPIIEKEKVKKLEIDH